jgi:hypothetical protein
MQCSPYNDRFYKKHKSCFSKKQLIIIATALKLKFNKNITKITLWQHINDHMLQCKHGDEHCWLEQTGNIITNSHVPIQPTDWNTNPYTWLTNFDILNVMTQYEEKYTSFKFIGVFPIDFAETYGFSSCISTELCNFDLSKFKKYNSFACVFNLDKHYQSGSHWVTIFFNTNKRSKNYGFYFFDSVSSKIPKEILNFGISIKKQMNDRDFELHQNVVRKQFQNTECGMFSLHFVTECLKNKSFHTIINAKYYDQDVHKLRKKLFRPNVSH